MKKATAKHKHTDEQKVKDGYLPIESYGIIGDLNTIALVGLNGSIDFMCFPDFDSPSLFAALLDKDKGGSFSICPCNGQFKSKQLYLPETNILITRFLSDDGIAEITDFMPVQEQDRGNELIRRVTTIKGTITYSFNCSPRFNYASSSFKIIKKSGHEVVFSCADLKQHIRLKSTIDFEADEKDCTAEFTLKAGESVDFMLLHVDKYIPERKDLQEYITQSLRENINYWKNWVAHSSYKGRWAEIVQRSSLVLKLMTSYRYGSLLAAATFSLPEEIGGERNWDYRFTWIRDASFTVYCLLRLGYAKEARNFINWVEHKCFDIKKRQHLQIMYRLDGEKEIKETILEQMEGYKKSRPVRIGNAAYKQLQLDIYGELMDAVYLYDKDVEPISYELWENLSAQMEWLAKNWKSEDDGIWEVRGGRRNFVYSRLMCWVAFDRAIKIANHRSYPLPGDWTVQRDEIFRSLHKDFWNKDMEAFVQYNGAETIDASVLMMPLVGFIGPKDPKWLSTLKCLEERLVDDFLVYRYRAKNSPDGLKGTEGTFSMCTFWFIECLSMSGQLEKARFYFEKMLGYANHVGLYAEQLGFSGEQLGNFPQAFTHLGLISAAINLDMQLNDSRNSQTD